MKKRFILLITVLSATFFLYAKPVEITFEFADGERLVKEYDDTNNRFVIWTSDADDDIPSKELIKIIGLKNWQTLTAVEFYGIHYSGDWSFLDDIQHLKFFGLSFCTIESLQFIENLDELQHIELDVLMSNRFSDMIQKEKINLAALTNLEIIGFHLRFYNDVSRECEYYSKIPNFINVQNRPALDINNNHIKKLTRYDKKLLRQYSKVYLYSNPLSADKEKVEKELKGIEFVW